MINSERIVSDFIELASIESISCRERRFADLLILKLKSYGVEVFEDDTAIKINGDTGNLICTLKGNKDVDTIIFSAHMDTVVPAKDRVIIREDDILKTDGKAVLGGDDVAGIVSILEAIRVLKENKIDHGDIQFIFSVAEEIGVVGIKYLDYAKVYGKMAFVLDNSGEVGKVALSAPSQNVISLRVIGKSVHAGMEPENGIDAIRIAAKAISAAKLGKIDHETTANVGIINGGKATNIVCDEVIVKAEVRSINDEKLETYTDNIINSFKEAAKEFGGKIEYSVELMYSKYIIKEESKIVKLLEKAAKTADIALKLISTCGGSDTNELCKNGIEAVDMSIGMENVHSVHEQIKISNIVKTTNFIINIIKAI